MARKRSALAREHMIWGYGIISFWLVGFIVFTAGPVIASLVFSFSDWEILSPPSWTGISNYLALFDDELFYVSLYNTAYYALLYVPLSVIGTMIIALLLNKDIKGITLLRLIYFLPSILPGVATALLWMYILNPDYGYANWLLAKVGLPKLIWLQDPRTAKQALVMMGLWGVGGNMPIFLGALKNIPTQLYEAAHIDGAGDAKCLWHITLPMLTPMIFFSLITSFIGTFQVFTSAYIATNGGPENSTLFYVLLLYRNAFNYFKMGYASAMAWILFAIVLLFTLVQFRLSDRWVYYETK
ncbi:MAG: sugar ABC transporter permease [Firmicutes bacterium]|nr:sugar ABC transporter permease [Bacillota bacterium]